MKVYVVLDTDDYNIIDIFHSLADAEEFIMLESYYSAMEEINFYNEDWTEILGYETTKNPYIALMLSNSNYFTIEEWEVQ